MDDAIRTARPLLRLLRPSDEKLGFERTGEKMVYIKPRGETCAHVNTRLAKSRFLATSK